MTRIFAIVACTASVLAAQPSSAGDRPRVAVGHMELRGLKLGRGASKELLDYLGKRLADGGTVDVVKPGGEPGAAAGLDAAGGPRFLLGGQVTRLDDTCLVSVQVVPIDLGLVTRATIDATGCDQAALERSLEHSAQALRNGFLRPPGSRPLVKVDRPEAHGLTLGFEARTALARHLGLALVAKGVARALPSPRVRQILARDAKREGRKPPATPAPALTLTVGLSKAGLGCQLLVRARGAAGDALPKPITRRTGCAQDALATSLSEVAEALADSLE